MQGLDLISDIFGIMLRDDRYTGLVASHFERDAGGWRHNVNSPAILENKTRTLALDNYAALIFA